ncbi:MAG: sugar isomerase domain-containing protein, partial [Patescibacteria group bacterium]
MLGKRYFAEIRRLLDEVEETQAEKMQKAADLLAERIMSGNRLFIFGCSHAAMLAEEMVYRAGGLVLMNPIFGPGLALTERPVSRTSKLERLEGYARIVLESSPLEPGDVLIVVSTSGRNAVPIEMAMEAKRMGATVIALTSLGYANAISSRHKSGKKLHDVADLVLDNRGIAGDAILEVEGMKQRICGTSYVVGAVMLHSIVAEVVERLLEKGVEPPVLTSGNLDGGMDAN